ncbi:5'-nucleotidase, lipoprotein e(P4) family [Phaeocystidibacter marisrubri]|uniref:5'-nucleotidase, lipoprotein e(P4) family n=2 Tax=Phaeocystidibacter marisrubri TaxID=1577780 RepID=A0A6L3ZE40_9FLAO|nr:5'-nucleotidase, lipoprotein e(P4) family [Phaeocystidibacter marisrubri]
MKMTILTDKTIMHNTLKRYSVIALAAITLAACKTQPQTVKESADNFKARITQQNVDATMWFNTSAEAHYIFLQTYNYATERLNMAVTKSADGKPTAIIVDLDETVLDNSPYQLRRIVEGEGYSEGSWNEWVNSASAKALPGALEFALHCQNRGVEIFYISNRSEELLIPTLANLKNLGFPFADEDHVYLKVGDESDKSFRRERVESTYNVLLYLGDNLRDFREDFVERRADFGKDLTTQLSTEMFERYILFPNPMYGQWEVPYAAGDSEEEANKKASLIEQLSTEEGE